MTDEAYDSGVISSDGTCSGQECAPASGAQGTVKMKVSNPVKKGTKRASTSTSIAGGGIRISTHQLQAIAVGSQVEER